MEKFIQTLRDGKIDEEDEKILSDNLNLYIDVTGNKDKKKQRFIKKMVESYKLLNNREVKIYDGNKIVGTLDRFGERKKQIICLYFGLLGGKSHTLEEIGEMFNVRKTRISDIIRTCLSRLAKSDEVCGEIFVDGNVSDNERDWERLPTDDMTRRNNILYRIINSKLVFIPDKGLKQELWEITPLELSALADELRDIRNGGLKKRYRKEKIRKEQEDPLNGEQYTNISNLGLSNRTYNALVRYNIRTIEKLRSLSLDEKTQIPHLGPKSLEELNIKLEAFLKQQESENVEAGGTSELEQLKCKKIAMVNESEEERKNAIVTKAVFEDYEKRSNEIKQNIHE